MVFYRLCRFFCFRSVRRCEIADAVPYDFYALCFHAVYCFRLENDDFFNVFPDDLCGQFLDFRTPFYQFNEGIYIDHASVICLINLANSIRSRLISCRQELATLRTVGMTEKQMRKMLLLEALRCTGVSLAAAIICSGLMVWALNSVVSAMLGHSAFVFPWLPVLLACVIAAGAICGFTILFAGQNKKEILIEEIRRSVV